MKLLRLSLLPLLGFAALGAHAAPLRLDDVPGDSAWFGHVDLEKAASGKLGALLLNPSRGAEDGVPDARRAAGLRFLKAVRGMTFYGDGSRDNGVALLHHGGNPAELRDLVTPESLVREHVVDGVTVLELAREGACTKPLFVTIPDSGPAVVAGSPAQVVAALRRPATASGVVPPAEWAECLGAAEPVVVFSCFCENLTVREAKSSRVKEVRSATFAVDAGEDLLRVRLKGTMTGADAATRLADLAGAFRNFSLGGTRDARALEVLNALKISAEGQRVSLELPLDYATLSEALREVRRQARAAKPAEAPAPKN